MRVLHLSVWASCAGLAAAAALVGPPRDALAQASPPPRPAAARPADAAFESAKTAFEAWPEGERKAVQEALIWTGDFNAAVSGEFGRRSFDAVNAFLTRAKQPANGMLDAQTRKTLLASAQRAKDAVKFSVLSDARTGMRLGVPQGILVKHDVNANGGSRWQSADGKITLDTRAVAPGEADLASLYERSLAVQTPGRQVTYKLLRPDFFVVSGETPTGKFYLRYASGPMGVRGFSLGYDKTLAKTFDRTVIAIANSFAPFPDQGQAVAAVQPRPPEPGPAATEPARPKPPMASGLIVAAERALTSTAVTACKDLRVASAKARILKSDQATGLALLESEGLAAKVPIAFQATAADGGVLVLSYAVGAAPGAASELVVTPAELVGGRLVAPLQPGASGAPVIDRTGAIVGVAGALRSTPHVVAGTVPPLAHPFVPAEAVTRLLTGASIALASAPERPRRSAGEIAAALGSAVVPVSCGE